MTAAPQPRTCASFEETTFGVPPADWDASGTEFLCIDPDTSALEQTVNENRNYRQRPFATRAGIHALRNSEFTFGIYATGTGVTTAEDARATTFQLADMLRNAWGGRRLGFASSVVTPSATAPDITIGNGAEYDSGDIIICETAAGDRYFGVVDSVSTDVLTLRWAIPAAVAEIGGTVCSFINGPVITNRQNAANVTHSFMFVGDLGEDSQEVSGCKLSASVEGIASGEEATFSFAGMCATFDNEGITQPALADAPVGVVPGTVGSGTATRVYVGNVDGSMVDVGAYTVDVTPGIAMQPVAGVGGLEGRHGYQATGWDETRVEITVPFDDSWMTDFEAGTHKQIMIQVGDQRGAMWGFFFPNAEIYVDPKRGVSQDETSVTLTFRPREYEGTETPTGDQLELYRSKMVYIAGA